MRRSSPTQLLLAFVVRFVTSIPIRESRLTIAEEWNSYHIMDHNGPGTYLFGYDLEDPESGNVQFRQEEKFSNGTVAGSYGYVDADGIARITHYVADENGYRVSVEDGSGRRINYPQGENVNEVERPSPQMEAALISSQYSSQKVQEQRTPPKHLDLDAFISRKKSGSFRSDLLTVK